MENLSTFIKNYIIDIWFTSKGKAREGETFEQQLERIIHEAIFIYRKKLASSINYPRRAGKSTALNIDAALLAAENKEIMQIYQKR